MLVSSVVRWVAAGCVAATLISCSSDSSTGLDLGSVVQSTRATPAPTEPPSTTSVVATTEPPLVEQTTVPSTPPPTDAPTTTPQPETTTPELSKEDQVKADFEAARLARHQCAYTPEVCDYGAIAIADSPMDKRTRDQIAMRLTYNLRAVQGKGDELVRVESVGFEGSSAFVTICVYDTVQIYDIGDLGNPDDDILYNGNVTSSRVRWEMRTEDGRWLLYSGTDIDRLDEGDLCGF